MSGSSHTIKEIENFWETEIRIDPERQLSEIDRKIYSGFLEHLGRCIYGGIVDYSNSNENLITHEVYRIDVAKALQDLECLL